MLFRSLDGEATVEKYSYDATAGDLSAKLSFYNGSLPVKIGFAETVDIKRTPVNAKTMWAAAPGSADESCAWEIKLNTTGYKNLVFSAKQKSTGSAPAYWGLAYRVGTTGSFTPIANSEVKIIGVSNDYYSALKYSYRAFELPAALNNKNEVYIRVYMTKNLDASDRELVASGGNTSINSIEVRGDNL